MKWVRLLDWFNRKCKGLCVRLGPHPKHRLTDEWHCWYMKHLRQGDDVLDYGSGTGSHSYQIARLIGHVHAWEPGDYVPAKTYCYGGPSSPHEPHEFYSAVMLLDVLQLIPERQELLRNLYNRLTEHGRLFIALPHADTPWRYRLRSAGLDGHYEDGAVKNYTYAEMVKEMNQAGFTVLHVEPTVYDTPWAGLIDLIGQVCWPLYHVLMQWKRRRVMANWSESTGFRLVCVKSS
mgnify:CR=1 FL=1